MNAPIDMVALAERLLHSAPKPANDLAYERTSSIIAAAIKSAMLTPHEMGQILDAITGRICRLSETDPEFEETANDLVESVENYGQAQNKRDERMYEQSVKEIEYTETE